VDHFKHELAIFPDSIPVLLTSSYLYQVLVTGDWASHTAPEFYQCKIPIPIPADVNLLKRPLIPFYRGRSPRLKKSYYLKNQWQEYKQEIRKVISP
jgi:energy-converting hydrogenase Eha subunit F